MHRKAITLKAQSRSGKGLDRKSKNCPKTMIGNTYRMAYTTAFKKAVYGLHAFKKKSKRGQETPRPNRDLAESRYLLAEAHYEKTYRED